MYNEKQREEQGTCYEIKDQKSPVVDTREPPKPFPLNVEHEDVLLQAELRKYSKWLVVMESSCQKCRLTWSKCWCTSESMFFKACCEGIGLPYDMVGNGFGTSVTDKAVIIRCCAMGRSLPNGISVQRLVAHILWSCTCLPKRCPAKHTPNCFVSNDDWNHTLMLTLCVYSQGLSQTDGDKIAQAWSLDYTSASNSNNKSIISTKIAAITAYIVIKRSAEQPLLTVRHNVCVKFSNM